MICMVCNLRTTFFLHAQGKEFWKLVCTPFFLESFPLYLFFVRAARRNVFTLLYPLMLRNLFVVSLFCARSAKKIFTLLYPFLLRKLFIVSLFCARSAKKKFTLLYPLMLRIFLLYPFLRAQREENFLLYCIP